MSASKCFIDANLFIYALTESALPADQPKREKTLALLANLLSAHTLITSIQVVNECHFVLSRKFGLPEAIVAQAIRDGILAVATVVPLEMTDYFTACRLRERYALSYWDSLVCASALRFGAERLYSEDLQDGFRLDERLWIVNPFSMPAGSPI
jgi:predicted nucleic acid-binding protein